jgi:DNA-binding Lrp family transcriptional regulator
MKIKKILKGEYMLIDIFGENPQVKVIDFFIENREYDHSLTDIARGSNITRPTLYNIIENLLALKIIRETRKNGNARNTRMFKLNNKSTIVQYLSKFDFELSKLLVRKELERQDIEALSPIQEEILDCISEGKYDLINELIKEAV